MTKINGPWSDFMLIFVDALTNIVYILGVAIIEFWLRPLFGEQGVPLLATAIMLVSELTLLLVLSRKCYKEFDNFVQIINKSTTYQIVARKVNDLAKRQAVTLAVVESAEDHIEPIQEKDNVNIINKFNALDNEETRRKVNSND